MTTVQGRLAAVSVRASVMAGWWVGVVLGLVIGSLLGAVLVWFSGAVLDWQRDLGFTLGIARTLLPLGDQISVLRWLSTTWWLVIPGVALVWSILSGVIGGLIGGLLAAVYNRSPRHASMVVELPEEKQPS